MSSNTTRADVRWAMIAPESLPADGKGAISVYNYVSSTWSLVVEDTTNSGQQMVEEIILNPANLDGSNNANFRFSVYHNGSDFPSDELVLYLYTIYDVREDVTDSDGDGIDDEFDTCPNGETGWTSTPLTDYDSDGCRDATEDNDDDNDLRLDVVDDCSTGELNWVSDSSTDYDGDGCKDSHPEDPDDDNDGYNDALELQCNSNPLDEASIPNADVDGDGICDAQDSDIDGDGIPNTAETDTSIFVDIDDTGTSPILADTDGDDWCDGPSIPLTPLDVCSHTDDAFPNDGSAYLDTDSDGLPDELWGPSSTGLVEDLDDDEDSWSDIDEADCGNTDPKDPLSFPIDGDNDGICDLQDAISLSYNQSGATYSTFEAYIGQSDFLLSPNLTGMVATSWEYSGDLPSDYTFNNGQISGIITTELEQVVVTVWANNSETGLSLNTSIIIDYLSDYDGDGLPDGPSQNGLPVDPDDDNDNILDDPDVCPQGVIGLAPEDDIDGDGCIDAVTYDLFSLTERTDLTFFENKSSPLPEICEFQGENNSLIVCSTNSGNQDETSSNITFELPNLTSNVIGLGVSDETEDGFDSFIIFYTKIVVEEVIIETPPAIYVPQIPQQFNFTLGEEIDITPVCSVCIENSMINLEFQLAGLPQGLQLTNSDRFMIGEPTSELKSADGIRTLIVKPAGDDYGYMKTVDVIFKVTNKPPVFDSLISVNYTSLGFYDFNENNNPGGHAECQIISNNNSLPIGLSFEEEDCQIKGTTDKPFTYNYRIQYSNSGGEGMFNLTLVNYYEEVVESEEDDNLMIFVFGAIVTLIILAILHFIIRGDKEQTVIVNIPQDQTPRFEINSNASDLNQEFALWCIQRLQLNGERKYGDDSQLQIPKKYVEHLSKKPEQFKLEFELSFATNHPNNWSKEHGTKRAETAIKTFLNTIGGLLGGKINEEHGKFRLPNTDLIQTEPCLTFSSKVKPFELAESLGVIRTAIWDYCKTINFRFI